MKNSVVAVSCLLAAAGLAHAQPVDVRVTIQNLSPANSLSFAPLRVGFHSGVFDSFNNGEAASAAITSIAEGGSGNAWFPAFGAADPGATLGSVGGALLPGATAMSTFTVDPSVNRFFTFGSMVIPSNDHFIGNDNPMMLFSAAGELNITSITFMIPYAMGQAGTVRVGYALGAGRPSDARQAGFTAIGIALTWMLIG